MTANKKWTKTHYEVIAECIRTIKKVPIKADTDFYRGFTTAIEYMEVTLEDRLQKQDPQFNRSKFLTACGVETELKKDLKEVSILEEKLNQEKEWREQ